MVSSEIVLVDVVLDVSEVLVEVLAVVKVSLEDDVLVEELEFVTRLELKEVVTWLEEVVDTADDVSTEPDVEPVTRTA